MLSGALPRLTRTANQKIVSAFYVVFTAAGFPIKNAEDLPNWTDIHTKHAKFLAGGTSLIGVEKMDAPKDGKTKKQGKNKPKDKVIAAPKVSTNEKGKKNGQKAA